MWICFLLWALLSAACLNFAVLLLSRIFRQHRRASSPTSWSSCWTPAPIHPSKTWRALCPRKSPNPAPSPPSCVSTRPRKAKAPRPPSSLALSSHSRVAKGFLWLYFPNTWGEFDFVGCTFWKAAGANISLSIYQDTRSTPHVSSSLINSEC